MQNGENLNYYVLSWDLKKQYKCRACFFLYLKKNEEKNYSYWYCSGLTVPFLFSSFQIKAVDAMVGHCNLFQWYLSPENL